MISLGEKIGKLSNVPVVQCDTLKCESFSALANSIVQPGDNLIIICDEAPITAKERLIDDLSKTYKVRVFKNVRPNPLASDIDYIVSQSDTCDAVVGIGGGSVLDSAKAVAMLKTNGGTLGDYLGNSPKCKVENRAKPLILMPTTAGTGSEMTKVGVFTSETGRKYTLGSPFMHASLAILNTEFIEGMPESLCASTGLDALDHALETIWNKNARPETDRIAIEAAVQVLRSLPRVYKEIGKSDKDLSVFRDMLEASCLAGVAFNLTGTAAGHALSFVLSEDWHVPHGSACAFTLLDVFDFASSVYTVKEKLALIAKEFFDSSDTDVLVEKLRSMIANLITEFKIPTTFKELGVQLDKNEIDAHFARAFDDPKMWNQIPIAAKTSIYPLLEAKC